MIDKTRIGGVILAGGRASRMGFRDKALQPLHERPLLDHVITLAAPQVAQLILSLNHNIERYQAFGLPVVCDREPGYTGPLLGIVSAMRWFQCSSGITHLACFPGDVPLFPDNIVQNLAVEMDRHTSAVAYACHEGQIQPLFSLWHLSLADPIDQALAAGLSGPKQLFESIDAIAVQFTTKTPGAFWNINSAEDLETAKGLIAQK
jgi:molybdenum cofactor guanylyltransferase